ncbi:MAG: hypothetical protein BroJett040_02160 [Oligoflexia bacterium]|nr:MAG: hypothetical protein BroJett040_02160 [Oligoflexia bacterium]
MTKQWVFLALLLILLTGLTGCNNAKPEISFLESLSSPQPTPTEPFSVTISQDALQSDPANQTPIHFSVTFSTEILASTFLPTSVTNSGTASVTAWTITDSGDHKNFTLTASQATDGTISPVIAASSLQDLVGGSNLASTSGFDNEVTLISPLVIHINNTSATEGSSLAFTASLSRSSTQTVTVDYTINQGTALATSDYTSGAAAGTLTFAPGETSKQITILTVDDSISELTENLSVTLSQPSGDNASIGTATGTGTITDNDPLTISVSDPVATEGQDLIFTVSLSNQASYDVTMNYATADGDESNQTLNAKTSNNDYTATSGTLTIPAGQTSVTITVHTTDDLFFEQPELMILLLTNPSSPATFFDDIGLGSIANNDPAPTVQFTSTSSSVAESTTSHSITLSLSQVQTDPVTVTFSTSGTATNLSDYTLATSSPITFAPGEVSKSISMNIADDHLVEATETIIINLTGTSGAGSSLGTNQSYTIQITDNDTSPTVTSFNPSSMRTPLIPTSVVVSFDRAMNITAVQTASNWNFTCSGGGVTTGISSVVWNAGNNTATANLTLSAQPPVDSTCTLTATAAILDSYGNSVSSSGNTVTWVKGYNIQKISAGGYHTCAIIDGGVWCWGSNTYGQLGKPIGTNYSTPTPVDSTILQSDVTDISAGMDHTCAVKNGGVYCWGENTQGQLGAASPSASYLPITAIAANSSTTSVSVGYDYTCAIVNGAAKCWGDNLHGQLGSSGGGQRYTPAVITGLEANVTSISAGYAHTCAIVGGAAKCWGYNVSGQLGNNSFANSSSPVDVQLFTSDFLAISAGFFHTCATLLDGSMVCWGENSSGRLGDGTTINKLVPTPVLNISNLLNIDTGGYHTCAISPSNSLYCWGYNGAGQLGIGSGMDTNIPIQITTPAEITNSFTKITSGYHHTCTIANKSIYCWGDNSSGQLSNGNITSLNSPQLILAY